jgi:hypothetical protein
MSGGTLHYSVVINAAGTPTTLGTGTIISGYTHKYVPILIKRYDYYKYNIVIGNSVSDYIEPETFSTNSSPAPFSLETTIGSLDGEFDISSYFYAVNSTFSQGGIALGCKNMISAFRNFRKMKFGTSQNIDELNHRLGTMGGIFNYQSSYIFNDQEFNPANWTGNYAVFNDRLRLAESSVVQNNKYLMTNGEVEFKAKIVPIDGGNYCYFYFNFRGNDYLSSTTYYSFYFQFNPSTLQSIVSLFYTTGGNTYVLTSSALDIYKNQSGNFVNQVNNVYIDFQFDHTFKVVTSDQWLSLYIDGNMILSWQDNNNTDSINMWGGYFGFATGPNTTIFVNYVRSNSLWTQIEDLALNAGDDVEQTVRNLNATTRSWVYSDLFGRFRSRILNIGVLYIPIPDPSTYTYDNLLYSQSVDTSDKEYYNQVTVYGLNGISAVVRDSESIAVNGQVRDMTITDYKITTYQDAYSRAGYELNNANKFNNQNTPFYINNVGAEVFDVVTITNTGNNSSGVNDDFRVYNETIENGGAKGNYSIEIETGTL